MSYPATLELEHPEKIANWRALFQWVLAIPHLIIGAILNGVAGAIAGISWIVILITGKLPEGIANFQIMALRYNARANTFMNYLYEDYPPFAFEMTASEPGGSPLSVSVQPALEDRNRLTVFFRFVLAIPAAIYMVVIAIVAMICSMIGFFAVLFTGKWPEGLFAWVVKGQRVSLRFSAYAWMLVDEYPPFNAD